MKNKKADVAITILVIGIIALCALTLLSFSLSEGKHKAKGINCVYSLQEVYNLAESAKYSESPDNYAYVDHGEGGFIIEKEFIDGGEVLLKIKYVFSL